MDKIKYMSFLEHFTLKELLTNLQVPEQDVLLKNAKYVDENEAHRRDQILESYLSNKGLEVISRTITEVFAKVPNYANILDVGAGTGFFTYRVSELMTAFHRKKARYWALDIAREMLLTMCER